MTLRHEYNISAYLCTGDTRYLEREAPAEIPYPDGTLLQKALDDLQVRAFLPGNVYEPNASRIFAPPRNFPCTLFSSRY